GCPDTLATAATMQAARRNARSPFPTRILTPLPGEGGGGVRFKVNLRTRAHNAPTLTLPRKGRGQHRTIDATAAGRRRPHDRRSRARRAARRALRGRLGARRRDGGYGIAQRELRPGPARPGAAQARWPGGAALAARAPF